MFSVCVAANGAGPLLFWQKVANGSRSKKTDRSFKMVANALRWLPDWSERERERERATARTGQGMGRVFVCDRNVKSVCL